MNEEADGTKTEQATSFKLDEARRNGMLTRSVEFSTLGVLLVRHLNHPSVGSPEPGASARPERGDLKHAA